MALLKSINVNHDNLPDDVFWNKVKWKERESIFHDDYYTFSKRLKIKDVNAVDNLDEIRNLLLEENQFNDKSFLLLNILSSSISIEEWNEIVLNYFNQISETKNIKSKWKFIYLKDQQILINPFDQKISLKDRIRRLPISQMSRQYKQIGRELVLFEKFFLKEKQTLLAQAKIKDEKLAIWTEKLEKTEFNPDSIVEMGQARVLRNHYTVNSNFNKSGKVIVTPNEIIFVRKRFNFLKFFSISALLPLLVFARPANKIIAIIRIFAEFLRIPLQLLKGLKPVISSLGPIILGLFVSFSFGNLDRIVDPIKNIFAFPILKPIGFGIDFAIENPQSIPVAFGFLTLFRLIFIKFFMRSEELVILPHDQCTMLLLDRTEIIGRWKIKGSDLLKAQNGIQYRIRLNNLNHEESRLRNERLASNIFKIIMGEVPIKQIEDASEVVNAIDNSSIDKQKNKSMKSIISDNKINDN